MAAQWRLATVQRASMTSTDSHGAHPPTHLVVDVHAEGDAGVEGGGGLLGCVHIHGARALQRPRLVVDAALDAAVAAVATEAHVGSGAGDGSWVVAAQRQAECS